MTKSQLIDIYYDLFDYLDEIDMFAEALKKLCECKLRKSLIVINLANLRLHNIEDELIKLNTFSKEELTAFNEQYYTSRSKVRVMYLAGRKIPKIHEETGVSIEDIKKMIEDEDLKPSPKGYYQTSGEDFLR